MMGTNSPLLLGISLLFLIHNHCYCHASPIEFTVHHRFSDPIKAMFPVEEGKLLPEEGTTEYLTAMVANDHHLIHGRRFLASNGYKTPVTFVRDNKAYLLTSFGYMYYANVSVGTPEKTFLVALDTESNYFWLPCECTTCSSVTNNGTKINIEVYDLSSSETGVKAPCDSPLCEEKSSCSKSDRCPYKSVYGTNSSSLGYLVEDVLHLATDATPSNRKFPKTTFGCGQKQSGSLLEGVGSNGILGLGWDKTSIPSILASDKLVADSFSMCISPLGTSRISFGDKGSSKQFQTPLTEGIKLHSTYSVRMNQLSVETTTKEVDAFISFNMRIFSTYLVDPLYTFLTENIDSHITEKKLKVSEDFPLQYCYSLSSCSSSITVPTINITFKGGQQYQILRPGEFFKAEGQCYYCLTIVEAASINVIGSNHMKGHRIVFDRDDKVLGWEQSDCKYEFDPTSTPTDDDTSSGTSKKNSPPGQENSTPMVIPTTTIGYLLSSLTFVFLLSLIMP